MKYVLVTICVILLCLHPRPGAAQDETMVLKIIETGALRRPPVTFPHLTHEEQISCQRCHHDYDKFGASEDAEGQKCDQCHKTGPSENPLPITKAFHRQCKGCHKRASDKGYTPGPVMCGQCHRR